MLRMNSLTLKVLLLMGVATVLPGCGGSGRITDEQMRRLHARMYQTVWVDPEIVFSDTLVTLIRADRVDSIKVEPSELPLRRPATVEIHVFERLCSVSVSLHDYSHRLIQPLVVKNLPFGFYRLTLNTERLNSPGLVPGIYYLRAEYCDSLRIADFTVD